MSKLLFVKSIVQNIKTNKNNYDKLLVYHISVKYLFLKAIRIIVDPDDGSLDTWSSTINTIKKNHTFQTNIISILVSIKMVMPLYTK